MSNSLGIKSIQVQRFKNIRDVTLELAPINVLVGANNSGKSAILQAIQFVTSAAQSVGKDGLRMLAAQTEHSATVPPASLYYTPVENVPRLLNGGSLTQNRDQSIKVSFGLVDSEESFDVSILKGKNNNLQFRTTATKDHWTDFSCLERPFSMYVPGLAGIAPAEQYLTPVAVRKAAARGHGNSVLRNVLWQLSRDTTRWMAFESQLESVFPGHAIKVLHDPDTDELVHVRVENDGSWLPIGLSGTGLLQTIQILAYVNLYDPRLLLLDEPDAHIHPDKQRALLTVVTDWASARSAKVLIATHSRHLLDSMDGKATFHWMQQGERNKEDSFDRIKVLVDLGALDRSDRLRGGQIDGVVLTEDATAGDGHKKNERSALRHLLKANNIDLARVQVWSYDGCTNVAAARLLGIFVREHAPAARILIHRDRDYLSDSEVAQIEKDCEHAGLAVFLTQGTDAESHFLSVDHLAAIGIDRSLAEQCLADATKATEEGSLDSFSRAAMERAKIERRAANKSGEPSPREIAETCKTAYAADLAKYRHGKNTLRRLRDLLSQQGVHLEIIQSSTALQSPVLGAFATMLGAKKTSDETPVGPAGRGA